MIAFFCFYNISTGIQAKLAFDADFRHCNIITYDGDIFLAFEFDKYGLQTRKIKAPSSMTLIRGLKYIDSLIALIVIRIDKRRETKWKPYLVRSCNEFDRYISGINIGFTFNPKHLYNKLLKYDNRDYELLYEWRR